MAWAMRVDAGSCRHSKAEELGIPGRPGGAEPAGDSYGTVWPSTRMNGSCAHPESWAARVDASATTKNSTVATASSAAAVITIATVAVVTRRRRPVGTLACRLTPPPPPAHGRAHGHAGTPRPAWRRRRGPAAPGLPPRQ